MEKLQLQHLIERYFRGQLAESEYEELTNLLQEVGNLQLFDEMKQSWLSQPEESEKSILVWKKLNKRITKEKSSTGAPTRRLFISRIAIAAILVVGIVIGGLVSQYLSESDKMESPLVFETPRGEKSMVTLPDGSKVWLNAKSKLVCYSFTARERKVELTGEAFFKVAHNAKSPFRVQTNECTVEVLGTEFNIMAYEDFGREEISLINGKVRVGTKTSDQLLMPGEALIIQNNKSWITKIDAERSSAWVDNKFDFKNIPMSELIKRLENWYDIDIDYENPGNKDVNFTGTFKNEETVWEVLEAIRTYVPLNVEKIESRKIKIEAK